MSDAPQHEAHHRPHTPSMAERLMEFDLPAEIHRLQAETTWSTGQNARTLIKYDDLRVVLTALQAKVRIPEHKADGRISVHVLSGHVQLRPLAGRSVSGLVVCLRSIKECRMASRRLKKAHFS